jgi:N-acetylneuraminate synthase
MKAPKTFIIAEAGVNHNGDMKLARALVDTASDAGADAVKFQTFKAEKLASRHATKADYQKKTTGSEGSQLEMLKKLELSEAQHEELINHCQKRKIQFLSTPFDFESLDLLLGRFQLPRIKISSGDLTNGPFLLAAAQAGKPLILSTGMATLDEVREALKVVAFGYLNSGNVSQEKVFDSNNDILQNEKARKILAEKITLLQCVTNYPADFAEVNLRAMETLKEKFQVPVGLSDHTLGIAVPIAAVAMGAVLIEKHFTMDQNLPGPDHPASLSPDELKDMVTGIRQVELALGSSEKAPSSIELKNAIVARKSLVAARGIKKGEPFTRDNLTVKRPGNGVSPMNYWTYLGRSAEKNYEEDELI